MSSFSTPAILLRRVDFGDYDLIITFLSLSRGKISIIAKAAKKSTKRFGGILEIFSLLELVCSMGRRTGLPVLQEANLIEPFSGIRSDIKKTAYASYWSEIINEWMEENEAQAELYHLLAYVLAQLDQGRTSGAFLSILFQMRFMKLAGLSPDLRSCHICQAEIEKTSGDRLKFDLEKGAIVCGACAPEAISVSLSKGTIKQLRWLERSDLARAARVRFSSPAMSEGLNFLESFVPYHLGKKPRSLTFLQQVRR